MGLIWNIISMRTTLSKSVAICSCMRTNLTWPAISGGSVWKVDQGYGFVITVFVLIDFIVWPGLLCKISA